MSNARRLMKSLLDSWNDALLFRTLATLRLDATVFESVDDIRWNGPRARFDEQCKAMESPELFDRAVSAVRRVQAQTA